MPDGLLMYGFGVDPAVLPAVVFTIEFTPGPSI